MRSPRLRADCSRIRSGAAFLARAHGRSLPSITAPRRMADEWMRFSRRWSPTGDGRTQRYGLKVDGDAAAADDLWERQWRTRSRRRGFSTPQRTHRLADRLGRESRGAPAW